MALILLIDVTGKDGFIALAEDDVLIDSEVNNEPMQHAAFLQPSIQSLLKKNKVGLNELHAIAINNGPGSYTGLRVGLASAKGLCFALKIPLITINSLQVIAKAASLLVKEEDDIKMNENYTTIQTQINAIDTNYNDFLYCSMIDARRMEVFFALYDSLNNIIIKPSTAIVDAQFLNDYSNEHRVFYTGSGADKFRSINEHTNFIYLPEADTKRAFCLIAYAYFKSATFTNLLSAEPFYCKEFYNPTIKNLQ
ncbi:MAG: tRNA (adenosine(37)-N6)-threonylcarbamoyltransferase complex dimerization subunit type 1 TsaB [Bacteroidota bacterium]